VNALPVVALAKKFLGRPINCEISTISRSCRHPEPNCWSLPNWHIQYFVSTTHAKHIHNIEFTLS